MLKLERLELSGFKSFVDPRGLDFAGRMTSNVGPNGCGKSNLADAVVWVLGERSAKTLRGDTMEDVIFAGSANRKKLGMAEVQLTFSADDEFEGADNHRLTIGRRLYRDGQSQYLINGKRSRLKDVRDTLMDTGLGIRAYSVIEQGKIGLILSGKPQERRRLIEEAAGVTRYKERRRIAEMKLEEARDNLSRLDDIISEVERGLRSLKRQASAAKRLQERKAEYLELLRQALMGRWIDLAARRESARAAIEREVAKESKLNAALHSEEADLATGREELERLAQQLAELHRSDSELAAKIEGKQEFLKGARHRIDELGERIGGGSAQSEAKQKLIVELGERLIGLGSRLAELTEERDGAATVVDENDQQINAVQHSVAEAEEILESYRGRLLTSVGEVSGTRNRLHQEQLEHEKGQLRQRHLRDELTKKSADLETAGREAHSVAEKVEELRQRETELAEGIEKVESQRDETMAREAEVTERNERLESQVEELERRAELLEELARAQAARRREVEQALGESGIESLTFLAESLKVPAGWEQSLDLYLGELADAVILPPGESGLGVAQTLAASRGTFRLLGASSTGVERADEISDPAVRSSLGTAVGLPSELAGALPPAYLVDSAADAERLAVRHPGTAFISKDRIWAQSGLVHVQGREASPGALAREQELTRLREQVPPLEQELSETRALQVEIVEGLTALREQLEGESVRLAEVRQELGIAIARQEDAQARLHRLEVEHETLVNEQTEVESELGLISGRAERLAAELTATEQAHVALEKAFDEAQRSVDLARAERETARTSGADRRGRLEVIEARLDAQRAESTRIETEIADGTKQIALWQDESERLLNRKKELGAAMDSAETELQEALEQRQKLLDEILDEQQAVDDKRAALKLMEQRIEASREARDQARAGLSELRVDQATVVQEVEHLAASFRSEFEEELPENPEAPERPLTELETDLERCRAKLESIGPVNLLAAQEFDEQSERHEFLTTQRADVADSVASLQRTIREINLTSSERFMAAFVEVNEHFGKTFTELFRGGVAEMRLMDEDDPLESGIEIVARPPGKRLQNIMLMSGGEKALTAIALLFALFHTKPSPFCILDEVDAPLDDVNTMRFVELLKTRSAHTQFIVVTHNKITMEAASTLYGVTMQERGVSNLVSVELDDLAQEEQAATA